MVLDEILESPLDCKEIQPVHSEGVQPWDFFGRNDAEADKMYDDLKHLLSSVQFSRSVMSDSLRPHEL